MIRCLPLIATIIILLQACAQVPANNTSPTDGRTAQNQQATTSYEPGDREQFVLAEKSDKLQKYGFDGFCTDTKSFACRNRLDYDRYVGMKGYFNTDEPSHTDFSSYQFWPVVLENGRELYYVSNPKYGGKYGSSADIVPLEQHEQVTRYSAEPLVPGSQILVESVEISFGRDVFTLDNGDKVGRDKLNHIRSIASQFPASQEKIAEQLLAFQITHDEVENQYFIQPNGSVLGNEAKLYIGLKPDKSWLRMKIKYYGDNWLFVQSYKIAADSFRWQSSSLSFERDHSGGNVWEWIDKSPTEEDIRNMQALATAENPIIRFQGKQYYSDFKLTGEQKNSITSTLRLYELLQF